VSNSQAILVVEDDRNLTRVYSMALAAAGYRTFDAGTGQRAMEEVKTRNPDLVLLDLGLPDIDGLDLVPTIRSNSTAPIIVVSGHGRDSEKVRALDAGADDYMTKPFSVPELLARMRATLRNHARVDGGASTSVSFGEYVLDLVNRKLWRGKSEVHLTLTEFKLMTTLARHRDRVVATSDLLRETWGAGYQGKDTYIRVYMHALRGKLESDPAQPKYILNEAGLGYRLNTSDR
jgi:two-component system KDP operon response regulator KdpE